MVLCVNGFDVVSSCIVHIAVFDMLVASTTSISSIDDCGTHTNVLNVNCTMSMQCDANEMEKGIFQPSTFIVDSFPRSIFRIAFYDCNSPANTAFFHWHSEFLHISNDEIIK